MRKLLHVRMSIPIYLLRPYKHQSYLFLLEYIQIHLSKQFLFHNMYLYYRNLVLEQLENHL